MTSKIDRQLIQQEFNQHRLWLVREFIATMLPLPIMSQNQFFSVKTADGIIVQIWGHSAQTILEQLYRFLKLKVFI